MRVWLLKDGENLPIQEGARPMRMWRLASALAERGHEVTWWASTFSHQRKELLFGEDTRISCTSSITLRLLMAGLYRRNVSLRRYIHHRRLAAKFREVAPKEMLPDIIVSAFPQTDLAYEAVRFGQARGIPTIVDIRDPWPDVFLDKAPRSVRPFAPWLLRGAYAKTRYLLSAADQWVSVSKGFEKWARTRADGRSRVPCRILYIGGNRVASTTRRPPGGALDWLEKGGPGKITFSFVGSFGQSYDLETVLEVARLCQQRGLTQARFVIAGDGEKFSVLKRLGRDLENLLLPGWLSSEEIDFLLSRTHVGLVPCISRPDTVPNKVFEYLGAGLPILSSLVGEVQELLAQSEAGLSYQVGDAEGLYDLVRHSIDEPEELGAMTKNACTLFDNGFCADQVYAEYAEMIEVVKRSND